MTSKHGREAGADTDYVADSELSPGVPVCNKQPVNTRRKTERGSSQGGRVPEELISCFMYNAC